MASVGPFGIAVPLHSLYILRAERLCNPGSLRTAFAVMNICGKPRYAPARRAKNAVASSK
jgi:hypothetical protein